MAGKWSRLFPAGDFRWPVGLRPGDARAFFAPTAEHQALIAEREHWLSALPGDCALLTEDGVPLLEEAIALAHEWNPGVSRAAQQSASVSVLQELGRTWEPDFVLLSVGDDGLTVQGGVVCFPSSWAIREKLGRTLDFTHSVVPDLNRQLAPRIQKALTQLAPGAAWERENWGLSRDSERNHFIHRARQRLDETITLSNVWLRIERQVLVKMPKTQGILFGIRLEITPLREVISDPDARAGLHRALATMSEDAARYKGVDTARAKLAEWLC